MMNPHQNININISYNLATQPISKALPAKKINKQLKTEPQSHAPYIEIKLNRKNAENIQKKSNQHKCNNEGKKKKSKINTIARNTCTPDLFADRRIKTEGPSADHDILSALKKEGKKQHHKSVQQPIAKTTQANKKSSSQSKSQKFQKIGHLTSCTVPNWKKITGELGEHAISQAICPVPKKRRAHSSSTFIKNDKVVSKLLNMSILASEIGGSQPITSERKANSSVHSRGLKQYMSSMDMRIISSMQQDIPIFADQKDSHNDIIRVIMRSKQISLEELTRKVTLIQRKWRQTHRKSVINTYKSLFQSIVAKRKQQERLSDISGIQHSPDNFQEEEDEPNSIGQIDMGSSLRKQFEQMNGCSAESDELQNHLQNVRWIQENQQKNEFNQTKWGGLNIKKYRELVDSELEKKPKAQKTKVKEKYKEQMEQWNSINKQITNIMNYKGSIDSQLLLDELIKQSKHNQYWIDSQFDNLDQSNHPFDSRTESQHPELGDQVEQLVQADLNSSSPKQLVNHEAIVEQRQVPKKYQDSLEQEQQDDEYDKSKYQPVVVQLRQEGSIVINASSPLPVTAEEHPQPEFMQSQGNDKDIDRVWISQQIMEDNVVRNYLDCGLGDFGININTKIMQLEQSNKQEQEEKDHSYNSSDEAIGAKFEQANLAVIKTIKQEGADEEPKFHDRGDLADMDKTIEDVVFFLISQFAADISVILKKSSGAPPSSDKKPVPQKIQGIQTNLNSIKDYLAKFIAFISKEENMLQKVVDTINKDIGPSSLEILTYLRPEPEDSNLPYGMDQEDQSFDDEEGLFVVPAELFEQFELEIQQEYKQEHQKEMGPRMRAYLSFWHRCIFESYNECLDYERPYGIEGKPYEWTLETKIFRKIGRQKILAHLSKAQARLLDLTAMVGGIIFQKSDSPFGGADLSEQQKHMMNQQRLSRILATELLESEQSWINYNDEMAELLVQLSRMIEEKMFFEYGTELKKLQRRRKLIAEESVVQESVVFNIDEL